MKNLFLFTAAVTISAGAASNGWTQMPVLPGTGSLISQVGDDFEDPNWSYIPRNPKSTEENDEDQRAPTGTSNNGRWYEGIKRGHPDVVRRVDTPPGGLPGSDGALLLKSMFTGIPNQPSGEMQQDDFIGNVQYRLKRRLDVNEIPSVTTRVYMPPVDQWEPRSGPQFGFRVALETTIEESGQGLLGLASGPTNEVYWPGLFIEFESKDQSRKENDYAYWRVRGNRNGADFRGPAITQTGWWTLGISVTPDGMVHYYAAPGVDELTRDAYITSQYPYGYRAERFRSFFYNVFSADNGRTWSTSWIVDDPQVFIAR